MNIKISKVSEVKGGYAAISNTQHIPGTIQPKGYSIPMEYTVEGQLLAPIEIGKGVSVLRTKRNGVEMTGFFGTSPVTEITKDTFKTQNSVYKYEYIPPLENN